MCKSNKIVTYSGRVRSSTVLSMVKEAKSATMQLTMGFTKIWPKSTASGTGLKGDSAIRILGAATLIFKSQDSLFENLAAVIFKNFFAFRLTSLKRERTSFWTRWPSNDRSFWGRGKHCLILEITECL